MGRLSIWGRHMVKRCEPCFGALQSRLRDSLEVTSCEVFLNGLFLFGKLFTGNHRFSRKNMFVFSHFFQPIHCFSRFHRLFDFCDAVMFSANIDLTQHKCHIVRRSRTVKHFQELSASLEEPFSRISSSCIPKYRWTLLNIGSSGRQQFRGQSYIVKVSGRTRYNVVHLSTWHQWKKTRYSNVQ